MEITVHVLIIEVFERRSKFDFVSMADVAYTLGMTPDAMDGRPQHGSCEGCESLYVIHLYIRVAKRRAGEAKGLVVRTPAHPEEEPGVDQTR
jgi:hypothetical protein